tara:strand:+ start:2958 stop:3638 length:681 start_codon:yes stop_codon:yes gene_type:complete
MERQIVDAALDAFSIHGFENARVADIARAAGVAEGTVYLYFRGKDALFDAVQRRFYARLTREAQAGVARLAGAQPRLAFLAEHWLSAVAPAWKIFARLTYQIGFIEEYRSSDAYRMHHGYTEVFDHVAREGATSGELREDLAPSMMRAMFYGGLGYACRAALTKGVPVAEIPAATAGPVVDAFLAGLGRAPAAREAGDDDAAALREAAARLEQAAARLEGALARQA